MIVSTKTLPFDEASIALAADLVRAGHPVAIASETVYGLAADATSSEAVARIFAAKGRPSFNPLIVHVADIAQAETIAEFSHAARSLAARFWPGPLTMVLPSRQDTPVVPLTTAGLATVAVRVPAHPAMRALISASGRPLAAPSANASGRISPTLAEHVLTSLNDRIALVVDAGPALHGLESTIVAVDAGGLRLLRPGPIGIAALVEVAGIPARVGSYDGKIVAPGQLASHYAPSKPVRLDATSALPGEWLIGFGKVEGDATLSADGNLVEAAARLFEALHAADASSASAIAIAPIPEEGLGVPINDRLGRAAAHR